MNTIHPETKDFLALSMLVGVGPKTLKKIEKLISGREIQLDDAIRAIPALRKAIPDNGNWRAALIKAEEQLEVARSYDARVVSPFDDEYPRLLYATKDDPFILYVRGSLCPAPEKSVAIIGTRKPTEHGKEITTRITRYASDLGWSTISGLATGCDSVVHRVTIDGGGHTVAVLAHGHQTIAPHQNSKLAQDILASGGGLISQYPFGCDAIPQQFAQRDKTQAGISQGVIMIQSSLSGGSLHASRAAINYGRSLGIPYPTKQDRIHQESNIQGNLVLADGTEYEKSKLLKTKDASSLKKIIILRDKKDLRIFFESKTDTNKIYDDPQIGLL